MQTRIGRLAYDAVGRAREGRVVSAFAHAANLLLDDGFLVTLLPAGTPMHPWGIGPVDGLAGLIVGMDVRIDAGALMVGPVSVALSGARVAELTIPVRPAQRPPLATLAALEKLAGDRGLAAVPEDLFAHGPIEAALHAVASSGDVAGLAGLIGLGPGLTPSCDDVVVGVLAASEFASRFSPTASDIRERLIRGLPEPLEERTSRVSVHMLRAACGGRYPEPLVELARVLGEPEVTFDEVRPAALRVKAMGHRSGGDMLRGFTGAGLLLPACRQL